MGWSYGLEMAKRSLVPDAPPSQQQARREFRVPKAQSQLRADRCSVVLASGLGHIAACPGCLSPARPPPVESVKVVEICGARGCCGCSGGMARAARRLGN